MGGIPLEPCGEMELVRSVERGPTVLWFDGRLHHEPHGSWEQGRKLVVMLPGCGLHELRIDWYADDPAGRRRARVALAPSVELRFTDVGRVEVARAPAGPRCLAVESSVGWTCNGRAVPPGAPFDLRACGAGELTLQADTAGDTPLTTSLLATLPGTYTASVKDGAIALAWSKEATGCAG